MLYNLIAWIFSQTTHAPIVYFGVTWYPILNLFLVSLWEGGIVKFMTSEGNNTLLPATDPIQINNAGQINYAGMMLQHMP